MEQVVDRVRGEFLEMPGLKLTRLQLKRLSGLEQHQVDTVLTQLKAEKFLKEHPDGTIRRHASES